MTTEELSHNGIKCHTTYECSDGYRTESYTDADNHERKLWADAIREEVTRNLSVVTSANDGERVIDSGKSTKVSNTHEDDDVLVKIKDIIIRHSCTSVKDIRLNDQLMYEIGLDSLSSIEVVMAIEKEFGITISEQEWDDYALTVGKVYDIVNNKLKEKK